MSKEEILEKYVFVTAGACGPCRFGMYEAEYRLALRNSGFDGFRVLLFQQQGLDQSGEEAGLELNAQFFMRIDVGSTTVKAVVVDPQTDEILWRDYQRHDTKQPEKTLELLNEIEDKFKLAPEQYRVFTTGSGASGIAPRIGAKFVQEVNAVALAVEKLYPACGSVVELGGQDAKIIIFKEDPETGKTRLVGDLDYDGVASRAEAISPVPGGVGPITDVWLFANTVKAAGLPRWVHELGQPR